MTTATASDKLQYVVCRGRQEDVSCFADLPNRVYVPGVDHPDVGCEQYTYLNHIVENYDCLADWTIFLQAGWQDHADGKGLDFLASCVQTHDIAGFRLATLREWDDCGRLILTGKWAEMWRDGRIRRCQKTMAEWFASYFGVDLFANQAIHYFVGSCFGVKAEVIRRRSVKSWTSLRNQVAFAIRPEEGFYMERSWLYALPGDIKIACGSRVPAVAEPRQDIQGWFDSADEDFYRSMVSEASNGARFVEVGSWKGRSTCVMLTEIMASGKAIQFDVVDTWEGSVDQPSLQAEASRSDVFNEFMANVRRTGRVPGIIRKRSVLAATDYPDASLDFVFLDASHDYNSVVADIKAWLPKVKPGGVIGGHDHDWQTDPGVPAAVNAMFGKDGVEIAGRCWVKRISRPASE
jgi:SAM-dependent methyltransferase